MERTTYLCCQDSKLFCCSLEAESYWATCLCTSQHLTWIYSLGTTEPLRMSSCASCGNALVLDFDTEEDATAGDANEAVPDDLQLPCGCHFHWQVSLAQHLSAACPHTRAGSVSWTKLPRLPCP